MACGAHGKEVKEAKEELRNKRQHEIVRIIVQNGKATCTAGDKFREGQVIYVPPPPHVCVRGTH